MDPKQGVILAIIAVATGLGYAFWRSMPFFKLYWLVCMLFVALLAATAIQLFKLTYLVEPVNLFVIAFSVAGLAAGPALWRNEVRAAKDKTVLYAPFRGSDLLTWSGWLKIVDRQGARGAALVYLGLYLLALAAAAATVQPITEAGDKTAMILALTPVAIFVVLSSIYLYQSARRVVPGA